MSTFLRLANCRRFLIKTERIPLCAQKLEFTVKMTCDSCVDAVKSALRSHEGIKLTGIDLSTQQVLVETTEPASRVQEIIEQSGRRAALMGMGSTNTVKHLGAAVAMVAGGSVQGVIRMLQTDDDTCLLEGTVDGLQPGLHRVAVHEFGDISEGCKSCGDVLDMMDAVHSLEERQGDLGVVEANVAGRAEFRMMTSKLKVWDTIGRSMILHNTKAIPSENSKVACGIIARSAGIFENAKRICACDGVSVWDERDVPIAGPDRQNPPAAQL